MALRIAAWVMLGGLVAGGLALAGHMSAPHASRTSAPGTASAGVNVRALGGTNPVNGAQVSLAQFAGKPVVINVWASWCPGCNQEARPLAGFAAAHPGIQVVGLDIEDTSGGARAFYRKWGVRYPSIDDPNGTLSAQLAITGVPTTLFLDAHHHVVSRLMGAGERSDFEAGFRAMTQRRPA